uniref:Uncharacterized protein n=1 Tax=Rhizophora mucronata TaxID=61149 RepID=A0A2P2PAM0_RHIMU
MYAPSKSVKVPGKLGKPESPGVTPSSIVEVWFGL